MANAWFSVDIEANGPAPGLFSMIQIGVVYIDPEGKLDKTFYGELQPLHNSHVPRALKVVGVSHGETIKYPDAGETMDKLFGWLYDTAPDESSLCMLADNAGFDWMFVNWYFHKFLKGNPFGHSCLSLTSLYKGFVKDSRKSFKHLRKTKHTHHPVDDAKGNAEALLALIDDGMRFKL